MQKQPVFDYYGLFHLRLNLDGITVRNNRFSFFFFNSNNNFMGLSKDRKILSPTPSNFNTHTRIYMEGAGGIYLFILDHVLFSAMGGELSYIVSKNFFSKNCFTFMRLIHHHIFNFSVHRIFLSFFFISCFFSVQNY